MTRSAAATDATRYLCAAAYLNSTFRERAIDELLEERYVALAPAPGIDLVAVLGHCLTARGRAFRQNAILAAILILAAERVFGSTKKHEAASTTTCGHKSARTLNVEVKNATTGGSNITYMRRHNDLSRLPRTQIAVRHHGWV